MPLNATSTSGNANTMFSSEGEPAIAAGFGQHLGLEQQREPEHQDQQLQHEVGEHQDGGALEARAARRRGSR